MAKRAVPRGALKRAERAPAMPATRAILLSSMLRLKSLASAEPMPLPIWMLGPSTPPLPPRPISSADATALIGGTLTDTMPALLWKAATAASVPCPSASGANRYTRSALIAAPATRSRGRKYRRSTPARAAREGSWTRAPRVSEPRIASVALDTRPRSW